MSIKKESTNETHALLEIYVSSCIVKVDEDYLIKKLYHYKVILILIQQYQFLENNEYIITYFLGQNSSLKNARTLEMGMGE